MDADPNIASFGRFTLDRSNRQLMYDGAPVELGSRYFDALALLVERRGELVTKDEFMDRVWRGIPVTDEALTQCIRSLRKALGDEAGAPRFIQTVPKHGYRFVATIAEEGESETVVAAPAQPASRLAGTCTVGGLVAGLLGGFAYGVLAGTGGAAGSLMLAAMIGALGTLAGAALGLAMAAMLAWRKTADPMLVMAGAVGGLLAGLVGNMLAYQGVGLLTGRSLGDVTGPLEGLLIGSATGFLAWLALGGRARGLVLGCAVLSGIATGILIRLTNGTLLAGSLLSLQLEMPRMQLDLARLGLRLGDAGWAIPAHLWATVIEATVFVVAMAFAALSARHRQ